MLPKFKIETVFLGIVSIIFWSFINIALIMDWFEDINYLEFELYGNKYTLLDIYLQRSILFLVFCVKYSYFWVFTEEYPSFSAPIKLTQKKK